MNKHDDFAMIAALDLDPIKVKLMHAQSGEGWSREKADAVELEYRRFLFLMKKFPEAASAPLFDVDTFWHYHILDTLKYMEDCDAVFGHYLHHFPYLGLRGEDDEAAHELAGERMKELYEQTFGRDSFALAARQIDNPGAGAAVTAWSYIPPKQPSTAWSYIPPKQPATAWSYSAAPHADASARASTVLARPTL